VKKFVHILYNVIMAKFVKVLGIVMVLSVLLQIAMRYTPTNPFMWTEELARLTFVWFCFMGATVGLVNKMHLSVDYLYTKVNERFKKILNYITWTLIIVFSGIITYYGILLVQMTYMQESPVMGLPLSFFYASVPVAGGLFIIYSLTVLIEMIKPTLKSNH
jgi:TRAP-type C4-dicarboxylate transport system permease small subunit